MPENEAQTHSPEKPADGELKQKRKSLVIKIAIGVLAAAFLVFLYWFFFMRGWASTDDAYVGGDIIHLNSEVSAGVKAYYTDNTDLVEQGQLLVQLDPTNFQMAFDKAKADLALAVLQVLELRAQVEQAGAKVSINKALFIKAEQDFQNRYGLTDTNAIPKEELEHAQADLEAAAASLKQAEYELIQYEIAAGEGPVPDHPLVEKAKTALRDAYIQLKRTSILAPADGYVANRSVQVGEFADPTRALMAIIPLDRIWVDANFKEGQLSDMRIGQPVEVTADMYGSSVIFNGRVVGLTPGTGSVFSLLPPQNATGNWIKIVQRVPVRVSLDPEQVKKHPLLLGLSMYVSVDVSDTSGKPLTETPAKQKVAGTWVYDFHMKEVDDLIDKIIKDNMM